VSTPILLLDVMGTLVHDPFGDEMPGFFGLSVDELIAVKHPTAWVEFELGELGEADFLDRFFADGRPFDRDAFVEHVARAYRWLPGIPELLADLRSQHVSMHALSNYPPWYRLIEDRLGLSRYLDWSFVSCETGVRKPEPEAFRNAARQLGVAPRRCLFVDDRESNCEAARGVGMDAIRFLDADRLRRGLEARGLLGRGTPGNPSPSSCPPPLDPGSTTPE
jgi:HAD superfamily hydrolase (TIGR01509 family)